MTEAIHWLGIRGFRRDNHSFCLLEPIALFVCNGLIRLSVRYDYFLRQLKDFLHRGGILPFETQRVRTRSAKLLSQGDRHEGCSERQPQCSSGGD